MNFDTWVERCAAILRGNQIESRGYRYTRPAPHVYEYQWLWDSCFHAITYRWFDPEMAKAELLSLIAGQITEGADAGMIPHMLYWKDDGAALWGRPQSSIITQPPLPGVAAHLIYERDADRAFLEALYPALAAYHEWFDRRRDPDGDHLVCLIHPWESGWDASPRWDAPMKLNQPTDEQSKAARHALVKDLIAYDCDPAALGRAGFYHVESVEYNAIRAADLEALAFIASEIGESGAPWKKRAQQVQAASRKFITPVGVYDLSGPDETPLKTPSAAPFILLFGGCVDTVQAAELVERLTGPGFWTPFPVPTTPCDDPAFDPGHYWRGNVWPSVNWLIYQGLRRYGYTTEAAHIAKRSGELVAASGFHEYFNPLSGEGYGPDQQSWATIVLDMIATENAR